MGQAGSGDARWIRSALQEISPSIVIIAVSYPSRADGLNHNDVIDEVECHCQVTGIPYLQVDVADATRWQQQGIPVYPIVGIGHISFINNNEELAEFLRDGLAIAIPVWPQDDLMMYSVHGDQTTMALVGISRAGNPTAVQCDRGLHNRGVLAQYMSAHGIQVYHAPLETPENHRTC